MVNPPNCDGTGEKPVPESEFDACVRRREIEIIRECRREVELQREVAPDEFLPVDWDTSPEAAEDLVGLALSGGGIRSATVNLGVLQKLDELKLLPLIDYLSTVSGGGFIGGWWSKWKTEIAGPGQSMPRPTAAPYREPPEITHLRLYSNYLIPRKGLFSSDTWRAATVLARNFFLNALVLVPLLAIPILYADLFYFSLDPLVFAELALRPDRLPVFPARVWVFLFLGLFLVWVALALAFSVIATAWRRRSQVWRTRLTVWQTVFTSSSAMVLALLGLAAFSRYGLHRLNLLVMARGGWLALFLGLLSGVYAAWKRGPTGGGHEEAGREHPVEQTILKIVPPLFLACFVVALSAGIWSLLGWMELNLGLTPARQLLRWLYILFFVGLGVYVVAAIERNLIWRRLGGQSDTWRLRLIISLLLSTTLFALAVFGHWRDWPNSLVAGLLCVALAFHAVVCLGWGTDPNAVSMHSFYKARLVRAYLGASNAHRLARPGGDVTEPQPGDDIDLKDVKAWKNCGAYHIVNATLNLVGGKDLATQERQAEVFELSPLFCGSARTGYRPTEKYAGGEMTLGTALAISGAAANPVMGPHTSGSMAMLLSLFNARLGYWIADPGKADWKKPRTLFWPWYMLRELLAWTTETGNFCYLSDGGHLENLGLYSLVKRRCRYIIVCDAGADPEFHCEDLANALRMIRIDFGCEVDSGFLEAVMGIQERQKDGQFPASRAHFAVGTITYPNGQRGTLLYLKSSLTGDEPTDVLKYAESNPPFPHQTTADQFFDEAQFESCRRLGYHIAGEVFGKLSGMGPQRLTRDDIFKRIAGP